VLQRSRLNEKTNDKKKKAGSGDPESYNLTVAPRKEDPSNVLVILFKGTPSCYNGRLAL
jgi:hypothetical protein